MVGLGAAEHLIRPCCCGVGDGDDEEEATAFCVSELDAPAMSTCVGTGFLPCRIYTSYSSGSVCWKRSSWMARLEQTSTGLGLGDGLAGDQCAAEGVYAGDAASWTISHRHCVWVLDGAAVVADVKRRIEVATKRMDGMLASMICDVYVECVGEPDVVFHASLGVLRRRDMI